MPGVWNRVYLHLVWGNFDRLSKLSPQVLEVVFRQIRNVGEEIGCPVMAIGGVEDHVHVVVLFSTTMTISKLVKNMKGSSSQLVNQEFPSLEFRWQGGYGVFPVSPQALERVVAYVENQQEHHRERSAHFELEAME